MYICIAKNPDGSHDYQIGGYLESGYAFVPATVVLPATFPYVEIEVAEVFHPAVYSKDDPTQVVVNEYTQLEVISMTAGSEVEIDTVVEPSASDDIDAMLVDHEYRLTLLELGLTE